MIVDYIGFALAWEHILEDCHIWQDNSHENCPELFCWMI